MYNEYLARAEHDYRVERFLADANRDRLARQARTTDTTGFTRLLNRLGGRRRPADPTFGLAARVR